VELLKNIFEVQNLLKEFEYYPGRTDEQNNLIAQAYNSDTADDELFNLKHGFRLANYSKSKGLEHESEFTE